MTRVRWLQLGLGIGLVAFFAWLGLAGRPPPRQWPPLVAGPAQEHEIAHEGKSFVYQEARVDPPYPLTDPPVVPEVSELARPELTLIRMAHAVGKLDWEMNQQLWDPASRAMYEVEMARHQVTPADRVQRWKEAYEGAELEIYKRIDIPGYVLLYVGKKGEPAEVRARALPLVLKADKNGRWWLTHDLKDHPVAAKDLFLPDGAKLIR